MTTYKMPKQPIDDKRSSSWSIAFLSSVSGGYRKVGGALAVFDLVNMETFRAHRMTWSGIGKAGGKLPIGGSTRDTGYRDFKTSRPVNFSDFDGKTAEVDFSDRLVHSKRSITFYDGLKELAEVSISGWGPSVPGGIEGKGTLDIYFSDGRPVGTPRFIPKIKYPDYVLPPDYEVVVSDDAVAITLPDKVLFDFDRDWLHYQASYALNDVLKFINSKPGFSKIQIEGHTDSKERVPGYNMDLSRRRAQTVLDYFKKYGSWLDSKYTYEARWYGASRPAAPNSLPNGADNPKGREKNRRVEIILTK